ncbi:MAG: hypothetical protein BJ554DRAFT_3265, partial [Olpidium bornovanus]
PQGSTQRGLQRKSTSPALGLNLGLGTLGLLLANLRALAPPDVLRLARTGETSEQHVEMPGEHFRGCRCGGQKKNDQFHLLLDPLLLLGSFLRLLGGADGGVACGGADLGLLGALGTDGFPGCADDSALVLDGLAGALLDRLLGDALLVHAAENDGPVDLPRVLALVEQRLDFAVQELERPVVGPDEGLSMTGVDLVPGKRADFQPGQSSENHRRTKKNLSNRNKEGRLICAGRSNRLQAQSCPRFSRTPQ